MRLGDTVLKQLFLDARTHRAWLPKDVPDSQLKELVDVMKMGPTSYNCLPARVIFVKSKAAKERLKPHIYFNAGRIVSYTLLGGVVGALGSALMPSPAATGVLTLLASAVMIVAPTVEATTSVADTSSPASSSATMIASATIVK